MQFSTILYEAREGIAWITLNRPHRLNAIGEGMPQELQQAVAAATSDDAVRVMVLRGAGRAFCAGYDLNWEGRTRAAPPAPAAGWDSVQDYLRKSAGSEAAWMSLWQSPKPVICQIHGWCVGGGTDMALCCDILIAAEDARIGYPPSRVYGTPTVPMLWLYRVGLERAKRLILTGEPVTGEEAARIGLVSKAVPESVLAQEVEDLARKMAHIPTKQLALSKLLVNALFENMGFRSAHMLGTLFDGIARNIPEGRAFAEKLRRGHEGFREAIHERDAPWGDYSARPEEPPAP